MSKSLVLSSAFFLAGCMVIPPLPQGDLGVKFVGYAESSCTVVFQIAGGFGKIEKKVPAGCFSTTLRLPSPEINSNLEAYLKCDHIEAEEIQTKGNRRYFISQSPIWITERNGCGT